LGWVSAPDLEGRTIWIVDAHGYGKRFIVRRDEKLTVFVELESVIRASVEFPAAPKLGLATQFAPHGSQAEQSETEHSGGQDIMMNAGIAANAHLTMNQTMLVGWFGPRSDGFPPSTRRSLGEDGSRHFLHEPDDFEIRSRSFPRRDGFIWHDGRFTAIDHPDAGHRPPGPLGPQGTTLYDINRFGDITGRYINSNHEAHSFVLRRGTFTPIDDPASPVGPGYGTQADGINDAGDIVGDFTDEDFSVHGFVLQDGTYTTINAPHAEHGRYVGTHAFGINDAGDIVLHTQPGQRIFEAYLLRNGQFKKIADPHGVGGTVVNGINAAGINAAGIIVGEWLDGSGVSNGMVYCNGIFTTHDDPNAAGGQGTGLKKINADGDIAGWYTDAHNHDHGFFLRLGHYPCLGALAASYLKQFANDDN
jgi:probable HAF family extracellular repeat protein